MNKFIKIWKRLHRRWAREFRTLSFRVRMLFNRKVHTLRVLTRNVRSHVFWVVCLLLVILIFLDIFFWGKVTYFCDLIVEQFGYFWGWLLGDGSDSNSSILRNLSLLAVSVIGLPFVIWRSFTAHKQAKTSESGLQNDRYQKGAEMLGNKSLATRLGGVYALERLAKEQPEAYHMQIMKLFCAFTRHPTADSAIEFKQNDETTSTETCQARLDVHAVAVAIGRRTKKQIDIENKKEYSSGKFYPDYQIDLSHACLRKIFLDAANLANANLSGAKLFHTNLSNADLWSINLSGAELHHTNLSKAALIGIDLSGVNLSGVKGLTQEQLDEAGQHPDGKPPNLPDGLYWDEDAAKKRYEVYWTSKS
ncbi:pentapeptide repeat-containing protein [Alphaproteobacteria bacterium]|nr:pentapeptide repeat-containing protein [Alphaproteobacteria bacterium]